MNEDLRFPTELKLWKYKIERLARRFGLDFYPIMYVIVTPDEMSEIAARHGFPTMPPHWRYGQESIWLKKKFKFGMGIIYEMVINTIPSYAYLLQLNSVITQKAVMAHVVGHVDMFRHNYYFRPTNRKMLSAMASDALRIERYFELIGRNRVNEFYDTALSFEWFIDPNALYIRRERPSPGEEERRQDIEKRKIPLRIEPKEDLPSYMDEFLNPPEWIEEEQKRLLGEDQKEIDIERGTRIPPEPVKDIFGFLARYAPLETWQRDVIAMIRRHSYYFAPQGRTKLMNEGWATLWEEEIITEAGMMASHELFQFAEELAGMQRRHRSINPYRLGCELWKDIKFRWDTGRHGAIWDDCPYQAVKNQWDEFAAFKTVADEVGYEESEFSSRWEEFSAFVEELKAGSLGYPREFFVRDMFTQEHLIPAWLKYRHVEEEYQKFSVMLEAMEPLELQATLLTGKLIQDLPGANEEELRLKARRDVYDGAGKLDLWLWAPEEVRRELSALQFLLRFKARWEEKRISRSSIPIPSEWIAWAKKFPDPLRLGKGLEKIFEVRATCDDLMFLEEFFTKEFCEAHQYYLYKSKTVWNWTTSGYVIGKRYVIDSRSFRRVKRRLLFQYTNFYLPTIRVVNANHNNNGELYLRHEHTGVDLDFWSKDSMYMRDVLQRLFRLWGGKKRVHLETIVTKKEEDKPWWFYWHGTKEKTTEGDSELRGTRVIFSYGFKRISQQIGHHLEERDSDMEEITRIELEEVTFPAPF